MTDRYVRSTDGLSTDDGTTWALARDTLANLSAIDTAGDRIFVSQAHAEVPATTQNILLNGTIANPTKVLCGNDATEPPAALTTTATISTTGASDINIYGHAYFYGITFVAGNGASAAIFRLGNTSGDRQVYERCSFQLGGTSASNRIYALNASGSVTSKVLWIDCSVKFASVSQRISINGGTFEWSGGSIVAGGSDVTALIDNNTPSAAIARIDNVDLSGLAPIANLCAITNCMDIIISNCKLPASWTGGLVSGTKTAVFRAEMYNCDSGDTNYVCWIEDGFGTIKDFSTLYLSGTDGIKHNTVAVPLSYKMTGNANTGFSTGNLSGMWSVLVNEITTSQTATLEITHNESAVLNDDEIWLEVEYPATVGSTKFTRLSDAKANYIATGVAQTTSTADWSDGLTARANSTAYVVSNLIKSASAAGSAFICTAAGTSSANEPAGYTSAADGASITDGSAVFRAMRRQKLAVTFTAAEQGIIKVRPVLAKASAVVWVASKVQVA